MQIGAPVPVQPNAVGATNSNGWVYGLFELAVLIVPILLLTMPLWGRKFIAWAFRPFGARTDKEN